MYNVSSLHVYFVGSTGSTNSDSDCQSLHAGVCIRQQIISSQDCTIAKEALEILVTCLQLRCELIGKAHCCLEAIAVYLYYLR